MPARNHVYRSQRVSISRPVELTFEDNLHPVGATSVNVSETGLLVRSTEARPAGTPIRFDFSHEQVRGLGEVAWTRNDGGQVLLGIALRREGRAMLLELLDDRGGW